MTTVQPQPTLVEQVVNAIVSEIVDGDLPSNARLIQDELARAYGVSRQPVQQALLLLRDRFAMFSRAVLEAAKVLGAPDILHCHDWQTALIPVLLAISMPGRR